MNGAGLGKSGLASEVASTIQEAEAYGRVRRMENEVASHDFRLGQLERDMRTGGGIQWTTIVVLIAITMVVVAAAALLAYVLYRADPHCVSSASKRLDDCTKLATDAEYVESCTQQYLDVREACE